jgi:nitrogen fixation/metabolism regulation signal transduction histidine kinase
MVLLARKLWQLYRDYRDHVPGSRLAMRTVLMFGALVIAPLLIVYLFSLDFINRGIDSWFRVEIKQGLNDALVLSRSALDLRLREQARRTEIFARALRDLQGPELLQRLDEERRATEAKQITVYDAYGRAARVSSATPLAQQPAPSPPEVTLQVAAGRSYVSLNSLANGQYSIETAAPIADSVAAHTGRRYVLIHYEVPQELSALAEARAAHLVAVW